MCGYNDSIYLVVSTGGDAEERLVTSGLLLDIRELGTSPGANSFFDLAVHRLSSLSERVSLCNEIRNVFAARPKLRWCGAEYESLYHRKIVQNACEINGQAIPGRGMSIDGVIDGDYPEGRCGDHSLDVLVDCMSHSDFGQRKLCALFHSIAIPHATIVYVGSAPGTAWIHALDSYPNINKVISIDPRDLDPHSQSRIEHHKMCVSTPGQILEVLGLEKDCVLVWDIRGDARDNISRDDLILREIAALNLLLQDEALMERFFLLHIKINMRHMTSYHLPSHGRLLIQPFSVSRDVVHMRSRTNISFASPSEETRQMMLEEMAQVTVALREGTLHESQLVANALTARYRRIDYLLESAYNASEEEVLLYTVNHNTPSRVLEYLRSLKEKDKGYVVSFFVGDALVDDPHAFPEGEALFMQLGTILDSRSFIKAKIESLYFLISEQLNDLFREEEYTSETYKIRKTEYSVVTRSRIPVYDAVRTDICQRMGARFPKFPTEFSIADNLISPSGHALRMTLEYSEGRASLAMFIEKIISNFRSVLRSNVKRSFAAVQSNASSSSFTGSLRHHGTSASGLERATREIWHGVREWLAGIDSAALLGKPTSSQLEQVAALKNLLTSVLACTSVGVEISNFYKNAYGTLSPLALARRGRGDRGMDAASDDPLLIAEAIWRFLSSRPRNFAIEWLTKRDMNPSSKNLWRKAIKDLRADALIRDYICHKAYIAELTDKYREHDVSKMHPLEFSLSCYVRSARSRVPGGTLLHLWNNSHHPECRTLRMLAPTLLSQLESMQGFRPMLELLADLDQKLLTYARNSDLDTNLIMSEDETKEFVIDLLARRWQKDFPAHRGVCSAMLGAMPPKYIRKPFVNLPVFNRELETFVKKNQIYLRFNVQTRK